MNFLEKLDDLMETKKENKSTLSLNSGVPYTTIDAFYKKGYSNIKLSTLRKLAAYFDVTIDYLIVDEITDPKYGKADGFKVTFDEMANIKKYRALDAHGRDIIDSVLTIEHGRCQAESEQAAAKSGERVYLSYYALPVSAGNGVYLDGDDSDFIEVSASEKAQGANFALRVSGDSMEPEYHDQDKILVKSQPSIKDGELGIFIRNGESYFKKWKDGTLVSLNHKYAPVEIDEYDEFRCVGKVLGKL